MVRVLSWILCVSLMLAGAALGQTPLAFEVASIKPAEALTPEMVMSGRMRIAVNIDGARVDIRGLSLADMLRVAYKVKAYQVFGPPWLGVQRWDVMGKMPAGATRDQVPEMMQALLADRFKVTLHRSTTEQSVYALVVARNGPKLQESPPDALTPTDAARPAGPGDAPPKDGGEQVRAVASSSAKGVVTNSNPNGNMEMAPSANGMSVKCTKMTAAGLVDLLSRFVDRPVLDVTELKGKYDLTLEVPLDEVLNLARSQGVNVPFRPSGDAGRASDPGTGTIFAAIQQFGLKLEPRKAPIELLVIDHVEKAPTEN